MLRPRIIGAANDHDVQTSQDIGKDLRAVEAGSRPATVAMTVASRTDERCT
jgi:hypothetical protein